MRCSKHFNFKIQSYLLDPKKLFDKNETLLDIKARSMEAMGSDMVISKMVFPGPTCSNSK